MRPYTPTTGTGAEAEDNSIDLDGDIVSSYKRRLYEEEAAVKLYKGETTSDGRPEDEMLVSHLTPLILLTAVILLLVPYIFFTLLPYCLVYIVPS